MLSKHMRWFTMQAATCGRCRSELGEAGRVCRHCRMDDVWVGWEARLFRLESRAMGAGGHVSHEDALRQVSLGPPTSILFLYLAGLCYPSRLRL